LTGINLSSRILAEECFVIVVTANPEPDNRVCVHDADGANAARDSDRPEIFRLIDAFEAKRRVKRIFRLHPIGFTRPLF
jgi:hypothetical protein